MTTFRCERLFLIALMVLGACGQTTSDAEHPPDSGDIKRLVQSGDSGAIKRELPAILAKIRASNGSIGTELVNAGFAPAPALPENYGYERTDGTSIGVKIRGEQIEVRVIQEPSK